MWEGNGSWLSRYQKAWDTPIENLSCDREVSSYVYNIHNTFAVAITKDGELRIASLWVVPISAAFFQTSLGLGSG